MQANQWPLIVFFFSLFFLHFFQRGFGRYLAGERPLPSNRLEATDKCCGQKHILSGAGRFELCWTTTTSCCLCHIQNVVRLQVATGWRLTNFKKCPCEVTLLGVVSDRAEPDLIYDFCPDLLEYNFLLGLWAWDKCCGQKYILSRAGQSELCQTTAASCCLCHTQ